MNDYFDVYIGNLSTLICEKQLKELFAPFGDIDHVFINDIHRHQTYGFVSFYNLEDAKKACEINNQNVNGLNIKVSIFKKTQRKLDGAVHKKSKKSILRHKLPKNSFRQTEKVVLNNILREKVIEYQQKNKDFMVTFKDALIELKNNEPLSNEGKVIKHAPEKVDLKVLESIVIRYYEPVKKKIAYLKKLTLICVRKKVVN